MQVDLSGFERFVPEPKSNDGTVDPGLQKFHGGAMPEHMWRYAFSRKRGMEPACGRHVFREHGLHCVWAETPTPYVGKQCLRVAPVLFS
jgi:hypothetical protein